MEFGVGVGWLREEFEALGIAAGEEWEPLAGLVRQSLTGLWHARRRGQPRNVGQHLADGGGVE